MTRLRALFAVSLAVAAFAACSSEESSSTTTPGTDAGGTDAKPAPGDASTGGEGGGGKTIDGGDAGGDAATTSGETCIGYGKGESCEGGVPPYGYVCFGGPPPGFTGCVETRTSASLGNNYCCPTNDCVAQPDQDKQCNGVSGKPHRFQCPPAGDGGTVAPPSGCVEHASGGSALEKFYCCP